MVDISSLVEHRPLFEERLGVRIQSVSAFLDDSPTWPHVTVRGEIKVRTGTRLATNTKLMVGAYDMAGRVVGTEWAEFYKDGFFTMEVFEVAISISTTKIARILLYPTADIDVAVPGTITIPNLFPLKVSSKSRGIQFEDEIRHLMEEFGYKSVTPYTSTDQGVDLLAEKGGRRVAIQVKIHSSGSVSQAEVQKFIEGMQTHRASEGFLVTTANLSRRAIELCKEAGVLYYDGDRLLKFCKEHAILLPSWTQLQNNGSQISHSLDKDLSVGRDAVNDLAFAADLLLSRNHFKLSWEGLSLWVEDFGSTNGTHVDDRRIHERTRVYYGSTIWAGSQRWTIGER
jgi:hypothetical protein